MFTVTSDTLLAGLRDPGNQSIWRGYVDRYRPSLVRWLQRVGLTLADAEDVAQEALLAFAESYRAGKYDPERGRLRSWLHGIAATVLANWRRRGRRRAPEVQVVEPNGGTGFLDSVADPRADALGALWDAECRDSVLRACLEEVRQEVTPRTYEAFVLFAREGLAAREVASRLGMSEDAVYGVKRRVLARIRELQPQIEAIW
jgi:RNA polymerase sigma-70 factor (ECF subfamily)